jgi:acyl dehydratase
MPINPDAILAHRFADVVQDYSTRDAILYALGIGLGENPIDEIELRFLLEPNLSVLPTMSVTLGTLGIWVRDPKFGIDLAKLVHANQSSIFQNALPPSAKIIASAKIISLTDRGEGKGAVLTLERRVRDALSGTPYCTLTQTLLLRADGGFGGEPPERVMAPLPPERPADNHLEFFTSPRAALIYRLSGDWNPLHASPEAARHAGFPRPILHGLASYGIAGWAILKACAAAQPARLGSLACRFSNVIYPGETIAISIWRDGDCVTFEASVGERKVLDQGYATLKPL